MCYRLHLATPLTLSEVRAMLPAGVAADAAIPREYRLLRDHLDSAQTVVELRRGPCGCDFVIQRDPAGRTDETHLRERALRARVPRARIAAMLETHRTAETRVQPLAHWQRALAAFVGEHARNAGPSLYHLGFTAGLLSAPPPRADPVEAAVSTILADPAAWLVTERLTLVVRG
jgi:hypothetical protein